MENFTRPSMPNHGNYPGQMPWTGLNARSTPPGRGYGQIPWTGPNAGSTPPGPRHGQMPWTGPNAGSTPPGPRHGQMPWTGPNAGSTPPGSRYGQMPWTGFSARSTPPRYISPQTSRGYSPFSGQSASRGNDVFQPRAASPQDQDQDPSYRENYCVRCVPWGPSCPCYLRANDNLLRREMGIQVDASDIASSRYTKDEYFKEGSDAGKVLSDQIRRVRDKQNLTINSSRLTIENAADKVAEKISDLAAKTPRTVKHIRKKLKTSIINHDRYIRTKGTKRKLSTVEDLSTLQPSKRPRVEPSTSGGKSEGATANRSNLEVPDSSKGTPQPDQSVQSQERYTTENAQKVTFGPHMFVITAEDENKFEYGRVDTVIPDDEFGHYVQITYFKLDENRNLTVYLHPNTKKPWTDEVPRDAIIKCIGFGNHVSLDLEREILELIQEIYSV